MLIHLAATLVLDWLLPFPPIMPSLLRWLGVLLVLSGLFLAFMAARQFLQAHTTLDPHSPVSALVTVGPYRFSRNPIYLGFSLFLVGLPLALGTYWGLPMLLAFIPLMNRLVIQHEETYLGRKFGEHYARYKVGARRWL
jgi:protein-S-isoprenylcysteine O-methyltransferase Ste14